MARRPSQQERIGALLAQYEPQVRDAFLASIRDIVDRVRLGAIITALQRGDIESAIRAIHVEAPAFQPLDTAIRQAFVEAGTSTAATMPPMREANGAAVVFRFDGRNPAAEEILTRLSSQAITEIVDDQRQAIRVKLTEGMVTGANPRVTALEVVGRVNAVTGRREGGILGLTSAQAQYVANARAELQSGDAATMRKYLGRGRRDKTFDAAVLKAIKAGGKPLDADTLNRITGRYSDRLLALRGEVIGRTESMASLNSARHVAWQMAADKGGFPVASVRKVWSATRDNRTRDSHRHINGESVGLNERFSNGLLYPGDPAGAASEVIACRCRLIYRRDFLSNLE